MLSSFLLILALLQSSAVSHSVVRVICILTTQTTLKNKKVI